MLAYTLAAGAGLAAAPERADASIIYTNPVDDTASHSADPGAPDSVFINLNNAGLAELILSATGKAQAGVFPSGEATLDIAGVAQTEVVGTAGQPSRLSSGTQIGPLSSFLDASPALLMARAFYSTAGEIGEQSTSAGTMGPWAPSATGSFLGVTFEIAGETHFGWVRFNTIAIGSPGLVTEGTAGPGKASVSGTLIDYAYESCPDTAIQAGLTEGGASCGPAGGPSVPLPASLGLLALGAAGLGLWRLRKS